MTNCFLFSSVYVFLFFNVYFIFDEYICLVLLSVFEKENVIKYHSLN